MPLIAPPLPLSSHHIRLPFLSFPASTGRPLRRGDLVIRMGGGPRTFPGGVSKWQWKRMQTRKAKQLLKARLARERQLYEMRKRAELRDAVSHLERPWDPDASESAVTVAPNLLSVAADDQLKVLADRFHRPGGVDLWNDRDGPQVFASPDTGRASARFFPKNAVHSVQPYARLGAAGERAQDVSGKAEEETKDTERAQGVRGNAASDDVFGDPEPTVEFMERDGMWEPVNSLDGGDDNNPRDWSWNNGGAASDLEDTEGVAFVHERRAMVRGNGRKIGVARWEIANAMAAGGDEDRIQRGHGFFSDSKGTRDGRLEQRWPERSSVSRRKRPSGRLKGSHTDGRNTIGKDRMGGTSYSDSELIHGRFELKWKPRNRKDTMKGAGRWKLSYDSFGNVTRKDWVHDESDSNSDIGRDGKLEPKWKARNKFNRSENRMDRPGMKYRANANNEGRLGRYTRGNNGDGRDRFSNGFASDLEEPTWKPRRKNEAGSNNGLREVNNEMSGRFRRGGSGAARRLEAHHMTISNREDGNEYDSRHRMYKNGDEDASRHRVYKNGGRRLRGDGYSLRPTSELHGYARERELDEM